MQDQVADAVSMSIWGMFSHSDGFMKLLIVVLLFASVWSWTIIIEKWRTFNRIKEKSDIFERRFWSGGSLDVLYNELDGKAKDPLSAIFLAAMREWKRSMKSRKEGSFKGVNLQERIEKVMQISIEREVENLSNRLIFLASTGSVSPLAGLFGTVWGIMASFQAIGMTRNTNIAAVAPGVAEALLTTAVGLIAAIPAVVAYNKFSNDIDRFTNKMETFAGELEAIISRQIEAVEEKG